MKVNDLMTRDVTCCTRETRLTEAARMMVEHDCGAIPVVDNDQDRHPVGVITDRDICCRAVAEGKNPLEMTVADCMTEGCITVTPETSLEGCCDKMEENQLRRAIVVDSEGRCCGIIAQADIARRRPDLAAEQVHDVSEPSPAGR